MTNLASHRAHFPGLKATMHGRRLAFLDSAASAQKPQAVIDAITEVMSSGYSNIHRGLYQISQDLTSDFEAVRVRVANFIGAPSARNIVFTRNATESINIVAAGQDARLKPGDEIILTVMEHHANIVPWQLLRERTGIVIRVIPIDDRGILRLETLSDLLNPRTRLVAFTHVSNALGTINPAADIIKIVKNYNPAIKVLVDGSQAVVHMPVDVTDLGADFYVFTGHKLYGPTGVGILFGTDGALESLPPYQGGGDMIERVSFEKTTYKDPPYRFEAGTPPIVEVIGLGAAIDYVESVCMEEIAAHEAGILAYATDLACTVPGVNIVGTAPEKAGILSFTMVGAHPSDIGMIMDQMGVAIRTGHHCCMPLMARLGVDATARASMGLYTNRDDIDQFIEGLRKVRAMFS